MNKDFFKLCAYIFAAVFIIINIKTIAVVFLFIGAIYLFAKNKNEIVRLVKSAFGGVLK